MSLLDGATTLVSSGFTVQLCFCLRAHADGRTDAFEVGALCCVCLSNYCIYRVWVLFATFNTVED